MTPGFPALKSTRTSCQPWCTSHRDGTPPGQPPDPLDQLCTHTVTSAAFGEFLMSQCVRDGVMFGLYDTRLDMTASEFEQLCFAGLAAIAAARARGVAA